MAEQGPDYTRALDILYLKDYVAEVGIEQEAAEELYQSLKNISAIEQATKSLDLYLVIRDLGYVGDRTVPGEYAVVTHGKFLCLLAGTHIPKAVEDYLETYDS